MTRQEEIKEAAYEAKAKHIGYGDSVLYAFIDGALQADEHPVSDLESTEGASLDALFDGDPVKEIDDIIDNLQK